jgi:tetratricopeptide (TPR) repeat protein
MPEPTSAEIGELKKKLDENADSLAFAPLADAYRRQGKLEDALTVCRKGVDRHPHYASGRVVLGRILQDQGKVEEALAEFRRVLEADPENIMAHTLIGGVLMQKKDYQSAIEEYQRVLTLNPDDDSVQGFLKEAIEKAAGENKVAAAPPEKRPAERKASGKEKESTASLTLAELYYKQGHFDKAIEVYQELLGSDPQNQILRQKLNDAVAKQTEAAKTSAASRPPKKDAFTRPPDHKEDNIESAPAKAAPKAGQPPARDAKPAGRDDTKFTSEDILQVMQRGGKDDVMVEEKSAAKDAPAPPPPPAPSAPTPVSAAPSPISPGGLAAGQVDQVRGVLAELAGTEGIIGSIMTLLDGSPAVSVGNVGADPAGLGRTAAAIFDSTNRSAERLGQGRLQQVLITAETGHLILVNTPGGHLIVLANDKIKLGLLRLALDPAVKKLEKFF